jgi:hypothetical protein
MHHRHQVEGNFITTIHGEEVLSEGVTCLLLLLGLD